MNCKCGNKIFCKGLCKKCYGKQRYKNNREKLLLQKKESYKKHKNKILQYQKEYRSNNKDLLKEKNYKYRLNNKDKINKRTHNYYLENKDIILKYQKKYWKSLKGRILRVLKEQRYRNKKSWAVEKYSKEEWITKLKSTNGVCPKCNRYVGLEKLELDHIYPISKIIGFQIYNINDIQPLCKQCNSSKSNKIGVIEQWKQYFL